MLKILVLEESLNIDTRNVFTGYDVDFVHSAESFLDATYKKQYDLYIVNYFYYFILSELRASKDETRTIFIDEFYSIYNLKKSLLLADDYMVKPLYLEELRIRIDYHNRKLFNHAQNIITYKDFYFHIRSKQLYIGTQKVKLSPNEMKLTELFFSYFGKPISKDTIYDTLESTSDGSLRVYISKLNKLGLDINYDRSIVSYTLV